MSPSRIGRDLGRTYSCRYCKAPIVMTITPRGARMPVDADTIGAGTRCYDPAKGHVTHFATCKNPPPRKARDGQA